MHLVLAVSCLGRFERSGRPVDIYVWGGGAMLAWICVSHFPVLVIDIVVRRLLLA